MDDYDYILKTVIVGDYSSGKTSLVTKYCYNSFYEDQKSTIGMDFFIKVIPAYSSLYPKMIKMQIWDTAGQERFRSMTDSYIKNAVANIIVFDVTDPVSFKSVDRWYNRLKSISDINKVIVLVGTKIDRADRKITRLEGEEKAKSLGIKYYEVSAQTGVNVGDVFEDTADTVIKMVERGDIDLGFENGVDTRSIVILDPKKKKSCC